MLPIFCSLHAMVKSSLLFSILYLFNLLIFQLLQRPDRPIQRLMTMKKKGGRINKSATFSSHKCATSTCAVFLAKVSALINAFAVLSKSGVSLEALYIYLSVERERLGRFLRAHDLTFRHSLHSSTSLLLLSRCIEGV